MSAPTPAIVLGGVENSLAIARGLGAAGIPVIAIGARLNPVRHSRFCDRYEDTDSAGEGVQTTRLRWLESEGPREGVLLACDDDGVELIARNRARLVELGYLPMELDDELALQMLDKQHTYDLALEAGIPVPGHFEVRDANDLDAVIERFHYPIALKPLHGHHFRRLHSAAKAIVVEDREELERAFEPILGLGLQMQVTEIIPGGEDQYYGHYSYLDEDLQPLFQLTKRKLRQYPPGFGDGCYHVTTHDDRAAELGLAFSQRLRLRGLSNPEFKRDERDGELYLIECNYRFTAIQELLRLAGTDPALLAYRRLTGGELPEVEPYRTGVRLWHPLRDLRSARISRERGQLSYASWLRSVAHRQHLPIFNANDLGPTFGYMKARVRRQLDRRHSAEAAPASADEQPPVLLRAGSSAPE